MIAITLLWTISQLPPILSVLSSNYNSELDDELIDIQDIPEYLTEVASSQASQDKMFFCHNQFYYNSFDDIYNFVMIKLNSEQWTYQNLSAWNIFIG